MKNKVLSVCLGLLSVLIFLGPLLWPWKTQSLQANSEDQEASQDPLSSIQTVSPSDVLEGLPKVDKAQAAYIVDGNNGQILFTHEENQAVEAASLSQLMLLYLVYQAIDHKDLALDQEVWISDQVYDLSQDYNIANVPLRQDLPYQLSELIEAVSMIGANGASLALAEELAGTEREAIQLMQDQLKEWGIEETYFLNVTGLTDQYKSDQANSNNEGLTHEMTAETVATIAYHLVSEYPQVIKASQIYQKLFRQGTSDAFEMNNPNLLIENSDSLYAKDLVDGLAATDSPNDGYQLVATAQKDQLRIIVVILGAKDEEALYSTGAELVDFAFSAYQSEPVIKKGSEASQVDAVKVQDGQVDSLPLIYQRDLELVVPIIDTAPRLSYTFHPVDQLVAGCIKAPVQKGFQAGYLQVDIADYQLPVLPSGKGNRVPVVVAEEIEEASGFDKFWRGVQNGWNQGWTSVRQFFTELFN